CYYFFFFSSRRRHTRSKRDWSSDVCSSDLMMNGLLLTAISLLFSILEVRSSPFIILDEVEAALDEANVLRFSHYLRNLTSYSQCIVITHRKKTMEQSDRLFGITMQEKGVSELISVDLKTYKEREIEVEY